MLRKLPLLLAASAVLLCAARSHAEPGQTLRLNVSPNGYPPYTVVGDHSVSGIVWDVATLIGQRLGFDVEARKIPRKRVDSMLLEGYIDATARAPEWTEHPQNFVFTLPIVRVQEVFFTVGDKPFVYNDPSDLKGKVILTHLGYKYPYLHDLFESNRARRFDVPRDRDMFSYLLQGDGRFDMAISDRLVGRWMIRQNGWRGQFSTSDGALSDFGLSLMLRPDMADFAKRFDRELDAIKASGELDAIVASYQ
ncbi:substrate-binding periplasmic protein [Marinobacter halodurans]|nr:transporter substrate-binding domain-containing protein [Marinobacter halodurans]